MSEEKASEEGYAAGLKGESAESNPYKNDSAVGRMGSMVGDILTGNAFDMTAQADRNAEAWDSAHGAGGNDKNDDKDD